MPRNRHTVEQIITRLREAGVALSKGQPVAQACRTLGITEQTYYCNSERHEQWPFVTLHERIPVLKSCVHCCSIEGIDSLCPQVQVWSTLSTNITTGGTA
jgi:hypothetical protein